MDTVNALIIDDDQDLCLLLKRVVESRISDVSVAHNIKDGTLLFNKLLPHILFLDNNLPDGQGAQEISRFKELSPQSKIVLISAMGEARERAELYGADAFLEKPVAVAGVIDVLAKLLNSSVKDTETTI